MRSPQLISRCRATSQTGRRHETADGISEAILRGARSRSHFMPHSNNAQLAPAASARRRRTLVLAAAVLVGCGVAAAVVLTKNDSAARGPGVAGVSVSGDGAGSGSATEAMLGYAMGGVVLADRNAAPAPPDVLEK